MVVGEYYLPLEIQYLIMDFWHGIDEWKQKCEDHPKHCMELIGNNGIGDVRVVIYEKQNGEFQIWRDIVNGMGLVYDVIHFDWDEWMESHLFYDGWRLTIEDWKIIDEDDNIIGDTRLGHPIPVKNNDIVILEEPVAWDAIQPELQDLHQQGV